MGVMWAATQPMTIRHVQERLADRELAYTAVIVPSASLDGLLHLLLLSTGLPVNQHNHRQDR